jgi:tRNA acetyltransferase TAN1
LNLIITCPRHFESEASQEIGGILSQMGDENPDISITEMPGIITILTLLNPIDVVKFIHEKIIDEPWVIRYCLRIIPVEITIESNLDLIVNEIKNRLVVIEPKETFRVTVEKRNSALSTKEIIEKIANMISNKVSLEEPDWIVLIEIIGNKTGLAVLRKESIISLEKIKRSLSD